MINRDTNLANVAFFIFNRFVKLVLFVAVLVGMAYEYFVVKPDVELTTDMYKRLSDYNEYLITLIMVLFLALIYMAFGMFARKAFFLSFDLLFVFISIVYFVMNYNAWNEDIPSDVSGYLAVFENISFLVRGLWVVLSVLYFVALIVKIIKQQTHEALAESGDLQQDMFDSQLHEQKVDKLISIHKQLEAKDENMSEEEYQKRLREVMREKESLHKHY